MRYSIGLSNEVLDTITNNDYLFCEDKVISLVSKYYGTEYEMAYARCFNFQYKINNTNGEIVKEAHRKLYNHLDTETEEYNEPFNTKKTNSFYKLAKMFEDIDVSAL